MTGWPFTAGETVLIITTLGGVVVSIVSAMKTNVIAARQDDMKHQLQIVHDDTNGKLVNMTTELSFTKEQLERALSRVASQEDVRATLAREVADELRRGQQALPVTTQEPIPVTAPEPLDVRVVADESASDKQRIVRP